MLHFTFQNMSAFYGPWPRGLGLSGYNFPVWTNTWIVVVWRWGGGGGGGSSRHGADVHCCSSHSCLQCTLSLSLSHLILSSWDQGQPVTRAVGRIRILPVSVCVPVKKNCQYLPLQYIFFCILLAVLRTF